MKKYYYRLEITDGEHQYYSPGVLEAVDLETAIQGANEQARLWYDSPPGWRYDSESNQAKDSRVDFIEYEHLGGEVLAEVDQLSEIPEHHYEVLKQYI